MNNKILLTLLILLIAVFAVGTISASEVNVTDSYATNLVDDTSDVSVPLENTADSSDLSVSSDSKVMVFQVVMVGLLQFPLMREMKATFLQQ